MNDAQQDEAGTVQAAVAVAAFVASPIAGLLIPPVGWVTRRWTGHQWILPVAATLALAAGRTLHAGWHNAAQQHLAWHHGLAARITDPWDYLTDLAVWRTAVLEQAWYAPAILAVAAWLCWLLTPGRDTTRPQPNVTARQAPAGATRIPRRMPRWVQRRGVLGYHLDGDLTGWRTRRGLRRTGRWVAPPRDTYSRHGAVIGQPGSGKTVTLVELARIAAEDGADVHFIDCKGAAGLGVQWTAAMLDAGVHDHHLRVWPHSRYDVWRGDGDAIANRLLACIDYGDAAYFEDVAIDLVSSACRRVVPRSSQAFLDALRDEAHQRKGMLGQHADTAVARFVALFAAVEGPRETRQATDRGWHVTGEGLFDGTWAYEDVEASMFTIAGLGAPKFARAAGRLLLADFEHYATQRKDPDQRVFLVVDELGVLGAAAVKNLIERVREYRVGVALSAQTVAGLGEQSDAVLEAVDWVVAHRVSKPQHVADLAGTLHDTRRTWTMGPGERWTGGGAAAEAQRWRVDPNVLRQLPVGQAVAIQGGRASRFQVRPPGPVASGRAWVEEHLHPTASGPAPDVEVVAVDRDDTEQQGATWVE